jgi:hypothetical protein
MQAAVKSKYVTHSKWPHFAFHILIYKHVLLKKQNIPQDAA